MILDAVPIMLSFHVIYVMRKSDYNSTSESLGVPWNLLYTEHKICIDLILQSPTLRLFAL